jgi:rhamnogalacturonyl hydrolase YesR
MAHAAHDGIGRRGACEVALRRGAAWLAGTCQVSRPEQAFVDPKGYPHGDYDGAMRTEYDTRSRTWSVNGPCFHTGQAVRALLVAERRTGEVHYRDAAIRGGAFLLRERIADEGHPQRGLLKSLEQNDDEVNVQVTIEALSGLLDLHGATGDPTYLAAVRQSADLLLDGAYLPDERLMRDHYSLRRGAFVGDEENALPGRAMVDDAVLDRLTTATDDGRYRAAFLEMADRLLEEEGPAGTWLRFPPWRERVGRVHGRKNWWWGHPLLAAFDAAREQRYLDGAVRAAGWYLEAQNLDGGLYYTPSPDGRHNSFGLCTSVVACAVLFWADLWRRLGDDRYLAPIARGTGYLLAAQFAADVPDPDVRGAFFEAPHAPDGSLAPGYQVRDLATIFAIRALDAVLDIPVLLDPDVAWADTSMAW